MVESRGESLHSLPRRDGGVVDGDKKVPQITRESVWNGFLKEGVSLENSEDIVVDRLQQLPVASLRKLHRLAIPSDIGDEPGCVGIFRSDVVGVLSVKDIFNDSISVTLGDDDQKLVIHAAPFGAQFTHELIGKDFSLRDESILCTAIDFREILLRYKEHAGMPMLCDGLTNIDFARLMVSHFGFRPTRRQIISNSGVEFFGPSEEKLREIYTAPSLEAVSDEDKGRLYEIFAFSQDLFSDETLDKMNRIIGVFSTWVQNKYAIDKPERSLEIAEKIARSRVIAECVSFNKDRYK